LDKNRLRIMRFLLGSCFQEVPGETK